MTDILQSVGLHDADDEEIIECASDEAQDHFPATDLLHQAIEGGAFCNGGSLDRSFTRLFLRYYTLMITPPEQDLCVAVSSPPSPPHTLSPWTQTEVRRGPCTL